MPTLRKYFPGIDKPRCEECSDRAEVVMEDYPLQHHHRSLCRDCATAALQGHPDLLASLVISLILKNDKPVLTVV